MERIVIIGAGGIGSAIAGLLARAGVNVMLLGRSPEHVQAVQRRGLRIQHPDGTVERVAVDAALAGDSRQPEPGMHTTHVVIATKSFDTPGAARAAHPFVQSGTWVTTVQNGLGNDTVLAKMFGADRVLPGLTTIGAERRTPGTVFVSAMTAAGRSTTYVGPPRVTGGDLVGARSLAAIMGPAGMPVEPAADIDVAIWDKLALAVMGPVSALLGVPVGTAWSNPNVRWLVEQLHDEVVRVALVEGVPVDREHSWANAVETYAGTGDHYTSMATDLLQGRQTEIDAITGAVVALAERRGVPTPAATAVVRLMRAAAAIRTTG